MYRPNLGHKQQIMEEQTVHPVCQPVYTNNQLVLKALTTDQEY